MQQAADGVFKEAAQTAGRPMSCYPYDSAEMLIRAASIHGALQMVAISQYMSAPYTSVITPF